MLLVRRVALACVAILGPFAFALDRLAHPAPWCALSAAIALQTTMPVASARQLTHAQQDKGSALWILVVGNFTTLVPVFDFALRSTLTPPAWSVWVLVGALGLGGGTMLRIQAIRTLGASFTGTVQTTEDQPLIQTGPYRWLRHPSYTGMLTAFLGECVLMKSVLGALFVGLAMVPVYVYRIRVEETAMRTQFGQRYEDFRARTWALVPWLY